MVNYRDLPSPWCAYKTLMCKCPAYKTLICKCLLFDKAAVVYVGSDIFPTKLFICYFSIAGSTGLY